MVKVKKRSTSNTKHNLLSSKRKLVVVSGILVFAAIGLASLRASFASENNYALKSHMEESVISLSDEKPQVVSKQADGTVVQESGGRSINVTSGGSVYCSPERGSEARVVEISQDELKGLLEQVNSYDLGLETVKQEDIPVSVGNTKTLQLPSGTKNDTLQTGLNDVSDNLRSVEAILEDVCKRSDHSVPLEDEPIFTPVADPSAPLSNDDRSIFSLLFPKVSAGGVPSSGGQSQAPQLDVAVEDDQIAKVNQARQSNKLSILGKSKCLTEAARGWSMHMSLVNKLYHSKLATIVEEKCGTGWWRKLGENVGRGGDSLSQFNAYMNSPGHRANILTKDFQRVGVGAYRQTYPGTSHSILWTTQLYATCMGSCADK